MIKLAWHAYWFTLAWSFVIFVSVVDGYLLLRHRDVIVDYEENPVGSLLLALGGGQVWLFLVLKLLGTILACMWLRMLYRMNPQVGLLIVMALAIFQFGLLVYLGWA